MADEGMRFEIDKASEAQFRAMLGRIVRKMPDKAAAGLMVAGHTFSTEFGKRRLSGHGASSLGVRSGALRRERHVFPIRPGRDMHGMGVGFSLGTKYAKPHEGPPLGSAGQPIKPRRARYLSIPVGGARTPAGVSKFTSPRQDSPLILLKTKAGHLLLARPGGAKPEIRWILKESVRIPERMHLRDDWLAFGPRALKIVFRAVAGFLERKGR